MPLDPSIKSVLIIGSGPIVIGQACEFDYSGSQAALALKEEGIRVALINSNPATIMTDPVTADDIYLLPLEPTSIEEILQKQKVDAVLPTMGGQTALNLAMDCAKAGIWEKYGVRIIGSDISAIDKAEDRELFKQTMKRMEIPVAEAETANSFLKGKEIAQRIGFPLVIRPSYTLGGTGGAFVDQPQEFDTLLKRGLQASPIHEVLVEQSVFGWKEYELEVMRDGAGNKIVICTIENVDPMGVHTGDSITVAPAMTLPDTQYQQMRNYAFQVLDELGDFAGGCNVQFSIDPATGHIIIIEINPRVSRSSALASKATGYPIARIAAKLAVGYRLDELNNQITKDTSAFFEPTLDYVIVKIPRWNFAKFPGANTRLGLQMKSVGEVMGIGRSFNEALQKACQSLEINRNGMGADGKELLNLEQIMHSLHHPSDGRIFHIKDAIHLGVPLKDIHEATRIDMWFLREIEYLVILEKEISRYTIDKLPADLMMEAKKNGYADRQIAHLTNSLESEVYARRKKLKVNRVYKLVDTCAAEFEAKTPYYYSAFDDENESIVTDKKKVVVFGSGPNRIGQGIEFDYCCVHGVLAAREEGFETIMINCNPETVSTDFNISDKLYFEPVFWEHIYDIIEHEKPEGVIVQLGGQTALKLGEKLTRYGINILGTSYDSLDMAEDRGRFSQLLKDLNIPYPDFGVAESAEEALEIAHKVGYPVLVRPSYVLGGQDMRIVINDDELTKHVIKVLNQVPGNKVLIDHFLDGGIEAEADAISDGEDVHIIGMMEHIEPAGIHSGDSTAVLPPFNLSPQILQTMADITHKLGVAMQVKGLINIQFAIKDDKVYVIEANPRASRTVPFIAKANEIPYVNYATKIMLGTHKLKDFTFKPKLKGYAIKVPVFSFNKFPNVDKGLGPEMKSTGEAIYFIKDLKDPFFVKAYNERNMYLTR
ncbi:MAG: carbamoyl-phosphate synthase large subunit [Bacteroidetes bacterium]|nr:MAG: carbamoyl-phosphate synthase large subunit [Bacteroidota bacterium]